jgi:uncharacterized membrane protein
MASLKGLRIAYIGDWVFYSGPNFIESPFENIGKDCQLSFLGKPVTDALEAGGAKVEAYSNWQLYHFSPAEYAALLKRNHVIVVSDVEARCFHLDPSFFDRSSYGRKVVTFPDRLKRLAAAVDGGKGLMYMGGWLSFSGHMEKGGWRRAPIANWLPFQCLAGEDLMESSEGVRVKVVDTKHPITAGLPAARIPPLLGYNEFIPRDSFHTIWSVRETGHPLMGVSRHGRGRMVTYASDPVPHWGINLMLWSGYRLLWQRMAAWAAGRL